MEAKMEKIDVNVVKFEVKVEAAKFSEALTKAYKKNVKKFNVPGFRKGKVPMNVVKQYYGLGVLLEDAVNFAIEESYSEVLKENNIIPVDYPKVDVVQVEEGKDFIYTAEVTVYPEVELGEYKGLSVPGRSWMMTSLSPFSLPSFFSTVTPGQLPTYWLEPVRLLNRVVLPQFGLPANAILIAIHIPLSMFSRFWAGKAAILLDLDHLGVSLTNAQLVVAHGQLHGVAQRCDLTDVDLDTLGQAHVHDAALDRAFAVQALDRSSLADLNVFKSFHIRFLLNTVNLASVCAGTDFRILGDHDAHGHGLIQRDAGFLDLEDQVAADLVDDRNGLANNKAQLCQVQTNFILTGDLLDGDGLTCFCHCQRHSTNTPLYAVWPAH